MIQLLKVDEECGSVSTVLLVVMMLVVSMEVVWRMLLEVIQILKGTYTSKTSQHSIRGCIAFHTISSGRGFSLSRI